MKAVWQGRVIQATSRYGEHAPMAAVCCNACRSCVSTNAAGLVLASVGGAAFGVWAAIKRLAHRDAPASRERKHYVGPVG